MNADGSNQVRLTNNSVEDTGPSFSPDGTKIAFRTNRDGNNEIYVMNPDGTNQTRITTNATSDTYPFWGMASTNTIRRAPFDFDGDMKTDISIFRPAPAEWWYLRSSQ